MGNFIKPEDFSGNIPGRGRKPSPVATAIAADLKGCPVGSGTVLTSKMVTASTPTERSKVRGQITTAAKMAGWAKVSVRWTDKDQPFVVRAA
jgi:hypothetical protein